ncbi:MAG: carboxypeptidase-like regulatory domain-containing protein [Polaribacter sp.]|nr:carboxypeptidase-like regulatory domain-containing protein [Polaribacter sp.]
MKKLIFFLFISVQVFSQQVIFKGKLVDMETKEPIVYANISFLKTNAGISSLEDGTFNLEIDKKLLQEKVHISCLNYKDTIVLANNLFKKTLFLQPKSFELKEVVISKKVDRELEVDTYKRRDIKATFGGNQSNPWTVAKFFKYRKEYKEKPYIKELSVYVG